MILAAKREFMQVKISSDFLLVVDSTFPLYWASLHVEDRSEGTASFPETT